MVEDSKEKAPSHQSSSDAEKKPAPGVVPPARSAVPAAAAASPPRPAVAPPRPTPSPAPQPAPKSVSRRLFIKLVAVIGGVLALVPFVPWGNYLLGSVSNTGAYKRQLVVLDINSHANGAAAGKTVNVKDLTSFPPNGSWLITYPSSGDLTSDSENPDTFQKYQLVRLPTELGGSAASASAFVTFSKVCVHLWCSPNYDPQKSTSPSDETYQCPCHGSIYQLPTKDKNNNLVDAGLAIAGPASLQPAPTNAIPMLTLTADANGDLYVEPPEWDVDHNGVLGYGRSADSYQNFILPKAKT